MCEHDAASFLFFFALLIANVEIVLKNRHGNILYTKNDCVIIIGRKRKGGF